MKVLIVDDEPLARARLRRMLEGMPEVEVVGEAENGEQALAIARRHRPQVVMMDVRMPGMDGLSAAQALAQWPEPPAVVFCTAYGDYALEAFEASAMGYLLKPVNQDKLAQALAKVARLAPAGPRPRARSHISAKSRRGVELVAMSDVRYFIADHKYVTVYHQGGELLIDDTLKELEDEFGDRLLRVHRNALVVVEHIQGLERVELGQFRVRLAGINHGPLVSRRHLPSVRRALETL